MVWPELGWITIPATALVVRQKKFLCGFDDTEGTIDVLVLRVSCCR